MDIVISTSNIYDFKYSDSNKGGTPNIPISGSEYGTKPLLAGLNSYMNMCTIYILYSYKGFFSM